MKRKSILLISLISIILSVFLNYPVKAVEEKTIRVWGSEITRENDVLRELADEYNKETGTNVIVIDRKKSF